MMVHPPQHLGAVRRTPGITPLRPIAAPWHAFLLVRFA
jgi:hypothetical protein